jgi:hypothetical protein
MMNDIDGYSFSSIEKTYQAFLVKRAKESYHEYKTGFSVSVPKSLKTSFLESCFYNGVDYHEIVEAFMLSYVGQNGIDVSLKQLEKDIEALKNKRDTLKKMIEIQGSIREKALADSTRFELEKLLQIEIKQHNGKIEKRPRRSPILYDDIRRLIGKMRDRYKNEKLADLIMILEAQISVLNSDVKDQLLAALDEYKLEHMDEIPGYVTPDITTLIAMARRYDQGKP